MPNTFFYTKITAVLTNMTKPVLLYILTQGHWGGAQTYVFDLARAMHDNFEVHVAVGEKGKSDDFLNKLNLANIQTHQLKYLKRNISPVNDLLTIFELKQLYKKIKPKIIHLNSTKAGILGSLATKKSNTKNTKLIYTAHGWAFNEPMPFLKKQLFILAEKLTAKRKDKIITVSNKEALDAINILNISKEKIITINLGIEKLKNQDRDLIRKSFGVTNNIVFGTIANLYKTKGYDVLLRAISEIKTEIPMAKFLIIGDGPEKENLNNLIIKYDLEKKVILAGFKKNAAELLPGFDIFVLPSRKEGMPYTILEAIQNKIPIISTNVGGIEELIKNKKTGLIVLSEKYASLAEAVKYAYNHPTEMREMSEKLSEENTKKYNIETMISTTLQLYQKV